ncbi:hypothetical protein LMG28688_07219 [Paraburkholderia caffeinitolerans]|uniref:Uncharacterized protein n=1 Tax=Paraburkholderia caffeinitolerans TaxID=1723730 RepID=A0A6J5H7E8_9BURK|nr:hypothetical protein [Paraburkholderia caffeinitolerans]CAB3810300.1 hypothetical protein LMG28688_07219 [Paraburkholderia caffeinitolerans]
MRQAVSRVAIRASVSLAVALSLIAPPTAHADDSASPCAALKRIVGAAAQHFSSLNPEDGRSVAQPYGNDAQCAASRGTYQCTWSTRDAQAGSGTGALEGVGADIASCFPNATHDENSPGRQHFYLGERGSRTEITAQTVGANRVKLTVSRQ